MERILSDLEMRAADAYTIDCLNISSQILMTRAGTAIADEIEKIVGDGKKKILLICGVGNNGGDGYVCARVLSERGHEVAVYAVDGNLSEDCRREKSKYSGKYTQTIDGDIIVDCLFGTGLARPITGIYAEIINSVNSSGKFVVSADMPSGICGENGLIMGAAIKADVTVAIGEYKFGHFYADGLDYCGKVIKRDIGIVCNGDNYAFIYSDKDIKNFFPKRKRNTHKGTYGSACIAAGSDKYIGAAALACAAALKSGCGYIKLSTCERVASALAAKMPQVIFTDEADMTSDAAAVGMGWGISEEKYQYICNILKNYEKTLIIDADGLNTLSKYGVNVLKDKKCTVILTPHLKEFSRLSGYGADEIKSMPLKICRDFAKKYGVILLLKSASSILTDGENTVILHRGNSALAKGGSGDMLSGFMCGTAARGVPAFEAATCAAYVLGMTAEICSAGKSEYCVTSEDIIKNLHTAVLRLTD